MSSDYCIAVIDESVEYSIPSLGYIPDALQQSEFNQKGICSRMTEPCQHSADVWKLQAITTRDTH